MKQNDVVMDAGAYGDLFITETPIPNSSREQISTLHKLAAEMRGLYEPEEIHRELQIANRELCSNMVNADTVALIALAPLDAAQRGKLIDADFINRVVDGVRLRSSATDTTGEAETLLTATGKAGLQSPAALDLGAMLAPDYLIKGWINRRTHALLFGKWNSGKSFAALHLCAHVAAGLPWFGNRVRQGGALYLGFEGAAGIARRVQGLKQDRPHFEWDTMPLRWANIAGALVREGGLSGAPGREQFDAAIRAFMVETGAYPALIVVDPLRDALGGAEVPDRIQPYLELMRKVSETTGATVLSIHHPGHSNSDRARGDSGLVASADSEIRLEWDAKQSLGKMLATKQRDSEKGYHYFARDRVILGTDTDGDEVATLVIREAEAPGADVKLTGHAAIAWAALSALEPVRDTPAAEVRQLIRAAGLNRDQVYKAIRRLVDAGLIEQDGDMVRKPLAIAEPPGFDLFPDE